MRRAIREIAALNTTPPTQPLRVALVADNVSLHMGGEQARPFHYFRTLRRMGVDAHLVAHQRNQQELAPLIEDADTRLHCAPDTRLQKLANTLAGYGGWLLPLSVMIISAVTGIHQRRILKRLVRENRIDLVHQVTPISPKRPSFCFGLGVPVVIGPLNGDMNYPPDFRSREGRLTHTAMKLARALSHIVNACIRGKPDAAAILVSNHRTRDALPRGCRGEVFHVVANAVDLRDWNPDQYEPPPSQEHAIRFVFVGRLVDFKGVDILLDAFAAARGRIEQAELSIVGDGVQRAALQQQAQRLGVADDVHFHGWLGPGEVNQEIVRSDVFAFPSLRDPGGAVIMEAMTLGKPIIALRWGGPADYADDRCAILLEPQPRPQLVAALADAMVELANDGEKSQRMGADARRTAEQNFDWSTRVSRVVEIYHHVLQRTAP